MISKANFWGFFSLSEQSLYFFCDFILAKNKKRPETDSLVNFSGKVSLSWVETRPRLIIGDPELIRLILTDKNGDFVKPPLNPLVDILQLGVSTLEGERWAKRRRVITPAFHLEKLKVPPLHSSTKITPSLVNHTSINIKATDLIYLTLSFDC